MDETSVQPRLAWSVTEAAEIIGISRRTMYELIRSRALRSIKIGSRRLIRHADLEMYLAALAEEAA